MTCPDSETLARYAEASLEGAAAESIRQHVDGCPSCRELLVTLVRSSHPSPGPLSDTPWDVPTPGMMLGRYRVTGTRGAGGMGVVVAAYDPQLDRQVALKLLRPDLDGEEKGRLRLVREAQLMARVRHPNVVTVHDVVVEHERVFIAMELVEGQTLLDWLEAKARSVDEVLHVFRAAGLGLAAAHDAGVVHRDFKPDNVLVDSSGQVLVSDFGLAWSQAVSEVSFSAAAASPSLGVSRRSAAIGTPAYMAPEQLMGEPVDARADQFSFCVALFEALEGERPFEGATAAALLESVSSGRMRAIRRPVPRGVSEALRKGLAREPAQRFPSMKALAGALAPPRRRAAPYLSVAGLVLLASAGGWWAQHQARCRPLHERLDAARAKLSSGAQVDPMLTQLRSEWDAVCGEDVSTPIRTCLEARVQSFEVTAEVLAAPETDARASAALISRLEGPESCRAGELLTLVPQPADEAARSLIRRARVSAMTADAARDSGRFEDASTAATRAIAQAQQTGWRPVEADARLAAAQVLRARGKFKEAEMMLDEALLAAEAGRHFEAIARISVQHILVVGTQTMRPEEAEPWVKRAEAALEQLPRQRLRVEVDVAITMLRAAQGRLAEVLVVSDRALAWSVAHDPSATASLHALRALTFLQHGIHHRALEEARLTLSQRQVLLGPGHPLTMHARLTLGEAEARSGFARDAMVTLTAAVGESQQRKDISPVAIAGGVVGMSVALQYLGKGEEALATVTRVRDQVVALVGPKHRYAALAERATAGPLLAVGQSDEALAALTRAVELGTEAVGAAHLETLDSRAARALVLARRGDVLAGDEARAVIAAVEADQLVGESPLVAARLALAWSLSATAEERAAAIDIARRVRGPIHPDVLFALLVDARSGNAESGRLARVMFGALQLEEAALVPLELPSP